MGGNPARKPVYRHYRPYVVCWLNGPINNNNVLKRDCYNRNGNFIMQQATPFHLSLLRNMWWSYLGADKARLGRAQSMLADMQPGPRDWEDPVPWSLTTFLSLQRCCDWSTKPPSLPASLVVSVRHHCRHFISLCWYNAFHFLPVVDVTCSPSSNSPWEPSPWTAKIDANTHCQAVRNVGGNGMHIRN